MNSVVTAIMRSLTPEIIAGLTSAAGLDSSTAQRAIGAVVPSILTGLANIASTPGGARHLANAVAQQPSNIFEGLASTLTGSAQTQLAEKGTDLLSSLFGGGALDTLLALGGLLMYMLSSGRQTVEPVRTSENRAIYLTSVPDSWVSIRGRPNDYVNQDIYNRAGDKLGTIKDVLVGADDKVTVAIINVGRYLGLGDKDVAVPHSALQRDGTRRIVIDATRENLQAAPAFKGKQ